MRASLAFEHRIDTLREHDSFELPRDCDEPDNRHDTPDGLPDGIVSGCRSSSKEFSRSIFGRPRRPPFLFPALGFAGRMENRRSSDEVFSCVWRPKKK